MTSNAILAKRIAELERQVSDYKSLYESSMLSEATAKQYAEEINKQNIELTAQIEALRAAIETALHGTVFDEAGNRDDDGLIPFNETKTAVTVLQDALTTTPQHHLREVRAEAGRAGFIAGITWLDYDHDDFLKYNIDVYANQYADQIRRGEVE